MLKRTSVVDHIKVDTFGFSSIFEIGDTSYIQGFSRALALQRDTDVFYGKEGSFSEYDIFTEPFQVSPITENIDIQTFHLQPIIKVNKIDIIGVSASSFLHIGSTKDISLESRVKHFRQLLPNPTP
ncbi:spore germination protein GerPE [Cytobacillus purgationiresistens]|uniref:Spore germination protein PE n=1 Tax=Cytobacillus purgationiresistens TaxID=863449 RepID=A0ABU0AC17_9BACI|nr:spore germination protein GerPE [Cytobacillus purgationiresistens]MDQ0268795.1 spore germination protein PE [Cytobacillus purgationiresistens]